MSKYLIIVSLFSIALTGCGGGSDSDSGNDNNGGSTGGGMTYVSGEFKSADSTGKYAPKDISAYGSFGAECAQEFNYNYFESENVLVYGDPSLPNSDYQHAATLVENNLSSAFSLMGMDRAAFDKYRPLYTPSVANHIITGYLEEHTVQTDDGTKSLDITDIDSDFVAPANWDTMEYQTRISVIKGYWNQISDEKQAAFATVYGELHNFDAVEGNFVPEKVVVCLDKTKDAILYGEGTLVGMNIAPHSTTNRSDSGQVVLHELIHTIQINVGNPTDIGVNVLDRWFSEGQATNLAGQKMASDHNGYYPLEVIADQDEPNQFSSGGLAYEHYAKAYSYIEQYSGSDLTFNLMIETRNYQGNGSREGFPGESGERFRTAFDANMLKENGSRLTLEEFRNDYHSLISAN